MDDLNLYVNLVSPRYKKRSKFSKIVRRFLRKLGR